jgi:hypothetical protein
LLEFDQERTKQLMRIYATYPEIISGGEKGADALINDGLDKLQVIYELKTYWYQKLSKL